MFARGARWSKESEEEKEDRGKRKETNEATIKLCAYACDIFASSSKIHVHASMNAVPGRVYSISVEGPHPHLGSSSTPGKLVSTAGAFQLSFCRSLSLPAVAGQTKTRPVNAGFRVARPTRQGKWNEQFTKSTRNGKRNMETGALVNSLFLSRSTSPARLH